MILEVEFRIPTPPSEGFRRTVLAAAPEERQDCCPCCGADRFHLLDALCDCECWQNRGLAVAILNGCPECRRVVSDVLGRVQAAATLSGNGRDGQTGAITAAPRHGRMEK